MPPSAEPEPGERIPATVIVAVSDRDTRRQWHDVLQHAGYRVRVVTRPAEVAKAQADGTAALIIQRDHPDDVALAQNATVATLALADDIPHADLLTHLRKALAEGER